MLIETELLTKMYRQDRRWFSRAEEVVAVDRVSIQVAQGTAIGLVGESGCGKSTLSRLLLGLERATSGRVLYRGTDITGWSSRRMRPLRSRMQMVFQNSFASFDPLLTVERIIAEPLDYYQKLSGEERRREVLRLLSLVELDERYLKRYPDELSGGQQQRVGIARALAPGPELLICDEPFSSLDFTLRRSMLHLLQRLKRQLRLTYLFVTHDLSLIPELCDQVAVMRRGRVIETAAAVEECRHPYTRQLLEAVPAQDPHHRKKRHQELENSL
ncbi:ATP-binding cassette domain-containing protein [Paenibacillus thiaminolyticus]|uniref:ABC transporter ATP-binding protein n=1 Tax=Paenibacillus thiaminolyticus TaxID=49283 RepID=A0AAP9IZL2_PANTH|nr:ABC transporter ATP-binding protein [Paenibacillus thiaminolyticus]MCY9537846.1 ATP-binding cassette domain-containing protein [Paenibacillus thiaminolyticus]MCY9605138.1 ATP-binding cassette domain-containing protein [Paenibacillus thiaminolyticus]MCY9607175.1 ATP-binding cassette domain-containing protein [Paenibacillus thiaminolyticus]MCY9616300.1 ATP-binding cassette domain-containing protein [Paenibacillus thiaminolyticus]MCY9620047.1 ATP-binding cassette domain-containing protein [Pae